MATYRSIATTETDPQAPLTAALMKALEANPTAITEGASGAPRIAFEALGTWYTTAGAVGTYVFATRSTGTTDVAFGATLAGSNLGPVSAMRSNVGATGAMTASFTVGTALSGTWQCMGQYDHVSAASGGGNYTGATLWLRIS